MMQLVLNPTEMGKSITDFGFLVATAAGYLVYSAAIIIFFIKWFVRVIDGIINRQQQVLEEILKLQKEQNRVLEEMKGRIKWVA